MTVRNFLIFLLKKTNGRSIMTKTDREAYKHMANFAEQLYYYYYFDVKE